jgi:hypothetical protein
VVSNIDGSIEVGGVSVERCFVFAQCSRPIHRDGIVAWDNYERPTFIALHKGVCDHAYGGDRAHGESCAPSSLS